MVKRGLRNYFSNIWCFFALLGFLALGVIVGLSIFIPSEMNAIANIATTVTKETSVTQDQLTKFGWAFFDRINQLEWLKDPFKALETLLNPQWLNMRITESLKAAGIDAAAITGNITAAANTFVKDTTTQLIAMGITIGIVTAVGYIVIRTYIHFNVIKDHNPLHFIFSEILNICLFIGVAMLGVTYVPTHPQLFWLITISMFIIEIFGAIFIAWIIYGRKKVKLKEVLNLSGLFKATIVSISSLAISMLIIYIIYKFGNIISCICIMIPLIIITMTIADVNITAYVYDLANKKNSKGYKKVTTVEAK